MISTHKSYTLYACISLETKRSPLLSLTIFNNSLAIFAHTARQGTDSAQALSSKI
jgi:hypothetical protein